MLHERRINYCTIPISLFRNFCFKYCTLFILFLLIFIGEWLLKFVVTLTCHISLENNSDDIFNEVCAICIKWKAHMLSVKFHEYSQFHTLEQYNTNICLSIKHFLQQYTLCHFPVDLYSCPQRTMVLASFTIQ